jgi:hypothetical protein
LICNLVEVGDELTRAPRLAELVLPAFGSSGFLCVDAFGGCKTTGVNSMRDELARADEPANGRATVGGGAFSIGAPVSLGGHPQ